MGARSVLFLLTAVNLLNYIDRWIIAAIMPSISSDLGLSHTAAGLIMSAFMLGYFITSPLFGYLADRYSRIKIISIGTCVWSLATALGGFGRNAVQIFLARTVVGVGEASSVSSSQAVLMDFYPPVKRNQVIAIYTAAIPVGAALGFVLGGLLAHKFGWRSAFFLAGLPGLILAAVLLVIKEPRRGQHDHHSDILSVSFKRDATGLFRNPAYMKNVLGYAAFTFTVGGFASWAPQYLVSVRHVPLTTADTVFGAITVIAGLVGSLVGGWWGGHYLRRFPRGDLLFAFWITLISIPFAFLCFWFDKPFLYFSSFALTEFLLFAGQPSVNVAIMESVSPHVRGLALAMSVFLIHLLGDLISPPIVGVIADHSNLQGAVYILPAALLPACWFYFLGYKEMSRQTR